MTEELAPSLQDSFLKHVQEHGVPMTVYPMSRFRGLPSTFSSWLPCSGGRPGRSRRNADPDVGWGSLRGIIETDWPPPASVGGTVYWNE